MCSSTATLGLDFAIATLHLNRRPSLRTITHDCVTGEPALLVDGRELPTDEQLPLAT